MPYIKPEKLSKKLPVGTRIIYRPKHDTCFLAREDDGKKGVIVEVGSSYYIIYLPTSTHVSLFQTPTMKASWGVGHDEAVKDISIGEQLTFNFER